MPDQYQRFIVILDREGDGYCAYCPALPGCCSQGVDWADALEMIKDAIAGVLESIEDRRPHEPALQTLPFEETPQLIAEELREALEFRMAEGDPVGMEIVAVEVAVRVLA